MPPKNAHTAAAAAGAFRSSFFNICYSPFRRISKDFSVLCIIEHDLKNVNYYGVPLLRQKLPHSLGRIWIHPAAKEINREFYSNFYQNKDMIFVLLVQSVN